MQILLTKYWVLAHVLILAGIQLMVPLSAGRFEALVWGLLSALLVALLLPPVREGESFLQARYRTGMAFLKDAFCIQIIFTLLFFTIQFINANPLRDLTLLTDVMKWVYAPPPVTWLPSTVSRLELPWGGVIDAPQRAGIFPALLAAFGLIAILRVAMVRKTRVFLLTGLNAIGGVIALSTVVRAFFLPPGQMLVPFGFFTAFGGGAFHLLLMCSSAGCVAEFFLERKPLLYRMALVSMGLNLLGALLAGSVVLNGVALLAAVLTLVVLLFLIRQAQNGPVLVPVVAVLLAVMLPVAVAFFLLPQSEAFRNLFLPQGWNDAFALFFDQWLLKNDLAWQIWQKNPLLGVGNGGYQIYAHEFLAAASSSDWRLFLADGSAAYMDFMQFLCENGVLGMLLLLLPVLMLIFSCLSRWVALREAKGKGYSFRYLFLFFGSAGGLLLVFMLSLIAAPFHESAVLFTALVILGCLPSWVPSTRS